MANYHNPKTRQTVSASNMEDALKAMKPKPKTVEKKKSVKDK